MNIQKIKPLAENKEVVSELRSVGIKIKDRTFGIKGGKKQLEEDVTEFSSGKTKSSFFDTIMRKITGKNVKVSYYPNSKVKQSEEIIKNGITVKLSKFNTDGSLNYLETFDPKTNRREVIRYINGSERTPEKLVTYGDTVHFCSRAGKNGGWYEERYVPEGGYRMKKLYGTRRYEGEDHQGLQKRRIEYNDGSYRLDLYEIGYTRSPKTTIKYDKAARIKKTTFYDYEHTGRAEKLVTEQYDANGDVIKSLEVKPFSNKDFKLFEKEVDKKSGNITEKEYYEWGDDSWIENPIKRFTIKDKDGNIINEVKYDVKGRVITKYSRPADNTHTSHQANTEIETLKKEWKTGSGKYSVSFLNRLEGIANKLSSKKALTNGELECLAKEFDVTSLELKNLKQDDRLYKNLIQRFHPDKDSSDEVRLVIVQILNNLH